MKQYIPVTSDQELEQAKCISSLWNQNGKLLRLQTVKIQRKHMANRMSGSFPKAGHSAT